MLGETAREFGRFDYIRRAIGVYCAVLVCVKTHLIKNLAIFVTKWTEIKIESGNIFTFSLDQFVFKKLL